MTDALRAQLVLETAEEQAEETENREQEQSVQTEGDKDVVYAYYNQIDDDQSSTKVQAENVLAENVLADTNPQPDFEGKTQFFPAEVAAFNVAPVVDADVLGRK
jgi:hypothetical protein